MPLEPGSQIGPYSITREIGRGGMGVVYLARDTRLDRDVAIKALPDELALDAARLDRFEREARVLAQLNHPNIAGIFGVEMQDGHRYLVLEYVEGDTLEDQLDQGVLPVDEALELAILIAAGVEAAHEAGIVHRDLKPANIKITPEGAVKVLDFGLARAEGADASSIVSAESATVASPVGHSPTVPGVILGTAPYMSPEQARGRRVDKRSDIWSFGVVLYEMLTGIAPFKGETVSDSIGAILHKDVDLDRLPRQTPSRARHAIERCLERNRANRYRDIGDVRIELERARTEPLSEGASGRVRIPKALLAVAAIVLLGAGAAAAWVLKPPPTSAPMHVAVPVGERFEAIHAWALSPDGETIAIVATERSETDEPATNAVYLRSWSETEFRKVSDSDRAQRSVLKFTPSGDRLVFVVNDAVRTRSEVRAMPVAGGPVARVYASDPTSLLSLRLGFLSDDELVVTSRVGGELHRVSLHGGPPELLVRLKEPGDRYFHSFVRPRPDGRVLLAVTWSPSQKANSLCRVDLDTGDIEVLLDGASHAQVLPDGHLMFLRDDAAWIAPFDADVVRMAGPARGLIECDGFVADARGERAVYRIGSDAGPRSSIVVVDASGAEVETILSVAGDARGTGALSPDGLRLAYQHQSSGEQGIWVLDIGSRLARAVTPQGEWAVHPTWLPDGRLVYVSVLGDGLSTRLMVQEPVPDAAPEELLPRSQPGNGKAVTVFTPTISPDGLHVIAGHRPAEGREPGLFLFDLGDGDSGRAFYATEFVESSPRFRPDGAWVAYHANGTGRNEVYLREFMAESPDRPVIHPVTTQGGEEPRWSPDGRTIYYEQVGSGGPSVFAVTVETEPQVRISAPRLVLASMEDVVDVVPLPDDTLAVIRADAASSLSRPDLRLVLNWGPARAGGRRN